MEGNVSSSQWSMWPIQYAIIHVMHLQYVSTVHAQPSMPILSGVAASICPAECVTLMLLLARLWCTQVISFFKSLCMLLGRWRWIALCRTSWSLSHTTLFPQSLRWLNCISMYCGQGYLSAFGLFVWHFLGKVCLSLSPHSGTRMGNNTSWLIDSQTLSWKACLCPYITWQPKADRVETCCSLGVL